MKRIVLHRRLRTGEPHVPWSAVFILSLVWFTFGFHIFAGGQALMFTVKRFNSDPRVMSIVTTLNVVIMLSPFVSYISDQVWTRLGRRRPFLITAWASGCLAMFAFAFLPQVAGAINAVLGVVGIPPIAEFWLLVVIIVAYTTLYDFAAPLEPLFLESVPPQQRGRFFAVRGVLFTCAVLFFYQILWPNYDVRVDLFAWLGAPGQLALRGEQLIYLFGGWLFLVTGGYLLFCIEETRVPSAPNKRFRELGVLRFVKSYVKDVFLAKENYPFYIVLVIPAMESMVWGNFGALMQNDQFQYSKANQALWAFPMGLISMAVLTPFSGWYSDGRLRVGKRWRALIAGMALAAVVGAVFLYRAWTPAEIRELAPVRVLFAYTLLLVGGAAGLFVVMVETLLDRTGREHTRAWVSLMTVVVYFFVTLLLYIAILCSENRVLPIMLWMTFQVINGTFGALLGTFVGPMIYEYMPRNRMGTINSGRGVYSDAVKFGIANLGAWWVWFYSARVYHPPQSQYDYSSIYLLQFALFVPALIANIYFMRLIMTKKILKWGVLEVEAPAKDPPTQSSGPASMAQSPTTIQNP